MTITGLRWATFPRGQINWENAISRQLTFSFSIPSTTQGYLRMRMVKQSHTWCNLVHLHIVFVLLYSACCSVNILSCVDIIQSFMYLLHVIILDVTKRCVWERDWKWEVAYFQPATSIDCLHLLFWWYLWEAVGTVSRFLSCSHTTSFSYVQNNNV